MSSFEFFTEKIVTKESCTKLIKILAGLTIGTSTFVFDPQILPVAAIVAAAGEAIPVLSEIGSSIGEKYFEHVALEPFVKKTWKVFNSKFRGKNDKEIADEVDKLSPQEQMELTLEISKFIEKSMKESVNDDYFILNLTNAIISNQEFKEELKKNPELERKVNDLGKDISIKLDEIQKEIKALVEIKLPKVETVLEKEKSRDARFFRPSGPEWIDFHEGFVVERKEVDEILKQFENKDLVVIKGNPASGKSVILRNVGYKLVNQGKNAYIIELKKTPLAIEGVLRLNHGYLLIEDVHLNPEYVDDIVKNIHNVKILLSTRAVEGRFGPTSPLKIPEYLKDAIEIKGQDAFEGIIQQFSEKKREIPESIRKNLIENNLWILAWELQAYEKYDKINEDVIYETVKDYIRKDLKNLGAVNAENVFLPLSLFYKYEIPLRKEFVENFSDCRDIEKLIELNEINQYEKNGFEYLTLHHSEIAEIVLKTFQKFNGFGNNVKEKVGGDWSEKLFYLYVQEFPNECIDVINRTHKPKLIKNLVDQNLNNVVKVINTEENINRISHCVSSVLRADEKVGVNLLKKLEPKLFKDKIFAEREFFNIGECICTIYFANKEVAYNIVKSFNVKRLRDKLEIEKGGLSWSFGIGMTIMGIHLAHKKIGNKLVWMLDVGKLKDKIEADNDVSGIGFCIINIADVSKIIGEKLVDSLDFETLKNKIEIEKNLWNIGCCIKGITRGNIKVAEKLIPFVINKIEAENDIIKISECIFEIADVNAELAEKLIPFIIHKMETEKDVEEIGNCIHYIFIRSKKVASKIVDQLDPDKTKTPEGRKKIMELKKQYLKTRISNRDIVMPPQKPLLPIERFDPL